MPTSLRLRGSARSVPAQHKSQPHHHAHSRMRAQQRHLRARPASSTARSSSRTCSSRRSSDSSSSFRRLAAQGNRRLSNSTRPFAPQLAPPAHPLADGQRVQLVLHLRARPHLLHPMHQQLPQVALFQGGNPDAGKPPFAADLKCPRHRAGRSSASGPRGPNARRVAHPQLVPNSPSNRSNHG